MVIRRGTAADAEAIAGVINRAFAVERDFREGDRTSAQEIAGMLERETFLVAEEGGRLAGAVLVSIRGEEGYFGMLAVDPSLQRSGTGRGLLAAAEEHCRRAGCTVMTMSTGQARTELIPYYQRLGYRLTGTELSSSPAFKRPIAVVHMAKKL